MIKRAYFLVCVFFWATVIFIALQDDWRPSIAQSNISLLSSNIICMLFNNIAIVCYSLFEVCLVKITELVSQLVSFFIIDLHVLLTTLKGEKL